MGAEVVLTGEAPLPPSSAPPFVYPQFVKPPSSTVEFRREEENSFFASIPPRAGVFLLDMAHEAGTADARPYIARTADLRRAAERLLREPEKGTKRLNLRNVAARMQIWLTASRFEQMWLLYSLARGLFPGDYRDFLHLRPPALLKINLRNPYPRCYVTRRILPDGARYFGPFASRDVAESFASEVLDLFKIRRCQIRIRRDPSFPGCIYSEMKMCLAPCFAGCSEEEYRSEVSRVDAALASRGFVLTSAIEREREEASNATDFERAALLHKRVEKISGVFRGLPDAVRELESLDAIIMQRALQPNTVVLFVILAGVISEPFTLHFGELSSRPGSAEEILREHLEQEEAKQRPNGNDSRSPDQSSGTDARSNRVADLRQREEHLAVFSRWFYSKPREGEILFRDLRNHDWPYRKILRACARILAAGETA